MSEVNLPEGWAATNIAGISFKGEQRKPDEDVYFKYIDIGSINRYSKCIESPQHLLGKDAPSRARKVVNTGDVLVSLTRPNLNAVAHVSAKYDNQIASTGFEVIKSLLIDSRYIFALTRSRSFIDSISGTVQGALYPAAKSSDVQSYKFPLPPLAEQKVIADKLDTLLAQVETTKARLDRIPQILKTFRQSVLAAAVSGKLTEEWRESNPSNWYKTTLGDLSEFITSGSRGWAKYYADFGSIFIRSQDINTDDLELSDPCYVSLPASAEGTRTKVKLADILITITGANVTKCARIKRPLDDAYVSQHVALIRLKDKDNSHFVELVLKSIQSGRKQLTEMAYGGGKPGLNLQNIKDVFFEIPNFKEQTQIVCRVEELFVFADNIEQKANAALERVNNLTQSILAKAFLGEITADWRAQNPDLISGDNSAEALLEKIKAEREALKNQPKSKRTAVKKKTGSRMSKQIIKVVDAIKEAGKPLSGQQLLASAGYPSDSSTDQLEQFFLDIREALATEKSIVKLERNDDGQDWFALAEADKNKKA